MKRRSILPKVKTSQERQKESTERQSKMEEEDIFETAKKQGEVPFKRAPPPSPSPPPPAEQEEVNPEIEYDLPPPPPEKRQYIRKKENTRDYSHLKEAREKGLQKRKARSAEKKQIMETAKQIEERKIYEQLRQKYGSDSPLIKPPVMKEVVKEPPKEAPKQQQGNYQIDYDRIIRGTAGMMSDFEKRIREDEKKKRDDLTRKYEVEQETRRRVQQEAYGMLSGRKKVNSTFQRSSMMQQSKKYNKDNWY